MATVTKNPDNSFTATITAAETRVLARWAQESNVPPARRLKQTLDEALQARHLMYQQTDGPRMREQYEALSAEKQAQIDAILAGG